MSGITIGTAMVFKQGKIIRYNWETTQSNLKEIYENDITDYVLSGDDENNIKEMGAYVSYNPLEFLLNKWKGYKRIEIRDVEIVIAMD